eukprot:TRINITY_DN13206_c0_g2_i2.p1 TRINITY_DN13206_c0_g2~~TRINITY_DN13206_c0_g2_i2.p1  ORF type:complete len:342 (+),score=113.69 TRINITY_DN13206_c0_g2_i2:56-1027(+)
MPTSPPRAPVSPPMSPPPGCGSAQAAAEIRRRLAALEQLQLGLAAVTADASMLDGGCADSCPTPTSTSLPHTASRSASAASEALSSLAVQPELSLPPAALVGAESAVGGSNSASARPRSDASACSRPSHSELPTGPCSQQPSAGPPCAPPVSSQGGLCLEQSDDPPQSSQGLEHSQCSGWSRPAPPPPSSVGGWPRSRPTSSLAGTPRSNASIPVCVPVPDDSRTCLYSVQSLESLPQPIPPPPPRPDESVASLQSAAVSTGQVVAELRAELEQERRQHSETRRQLQIRSDQVLELLRLHAALQHETVEAVHAALRAGGVSLD